MNIKTSPLCFRALLVAFVCLSRASGSEAETVRKRIRDLRPAVVGIVIPLVNNGMPDGRFLVIGSGFYIGPQEIVTGAHVLADYPFDQVAILSADDIEASQSTGTMTSEAYFGRRLATVYLARSPANFDRATIENKDEHGDVAILKPSRMGQRTLALGTFDSVDAGDDVIYLGFPFGYNRLITHRGMISFKGRIDGAEKFQIDGIVNSGNSGGPLIAPNGSAVVGVVLAKEGNVGPYLKSLQSLPKQSGYVGVSAGAFNLDFQRFSNEVSNAIDSHIQMGIGYASSIDYVRKLKRK